MLIGHSSFGPIVISGTQEGKETVSPVQKGAELVSSLTEFDKAVQAIDLAYMARDEIVLCLIGPVGVGKTQAVYASAAKRGAKVVEIIASQILPNEVSGITMPEAETKSMQIYDHARLSSLKDGDVLFFDELLEADQSVLSACLTLIQERRLMSGKKLPDIQIVAACNPTQSPQVLKASIRQRFLFHEYKLEKNDVRTYIVKKYPMLPQQIIGSIVDDIKVTDNNSYNILTPRSLDKMLHWITSASTWEDRISIAEEAGELFSIFKFKDLVISWQVSEKHREEQETKDKQDKAVMDEVINRFPDLKDKLSACEFISEVFNVLQQEANWDDIKHQLESIDIQSVLEGVSECSGN